MLDSTSVGATPSKLTEGFRYHQSRARTVVEERRQNVRILFALPVRVDGDGVSMEATAVNVSDTGALLLAPRPCPVGSTIQLRNRETGVSADFTVLWNSFDDSAKAFSWRLGVQTVENTRTPEAARAWARTFWGPEYEDARQGA